jgi:dethiobiotin synthetase
MGQLTAGSRAYFVTGTDTEVGKTFFSVALLNAFNKLELKTAAYKPIAAGCENSPNGLRNNDAIALQQAGSMELSYEEVNPIALAEPIAPHLAAQIAKNSGDPIDLSLDRIQQGFSLLLQKQPDVLIVEGAGGWRLPLGENEQGQQSFLSDFVAKKNLSVILVVGMRLGCLNHAMLTADSVRQHGLKIVGWVANTLDPEMPYLAENIETLKKLLNAPLIAILPKLNQPQDALNFLDLSCLGR